MIVAVRSYMTYLNITILIEDTKTTIEKNNEEIAYLRNFYKTYLDSDY
jgi:hypothetical protein